MKKIVKNLKIWGMLNKLSLMSDIEYRGNAVFYFLSSFGWFLSSLLFFNVLFQFNDLLGDWTREEMLLMYAIHNLSYAFTIIFIWDSIYYNFLWAVTRGMLDQKILKPANLRLLTTTGVFDLSGLLHMIPSLFLLNYALSNISQQLSWVNILLFILLFVIGLFLAYCMLCILFFLSFWTKSARRFGEIFWMLQSKTKMPLDIVPVWLQALLLFVLPVAFLVFVPFKALLGLLEFKTLVLGLILCIVFWVASQKMLEAGLKRYESASS